jgi:hypothetical protein
LLRRPPVDLDSLLTRSQKENVLRTSLQKLGTGGDFTLTFDRRFNYDFEVRQNGATPSVTFSVSLNNERYGFAVRECARALRDIRRSHAVAVVLDVAFCSMMRMPAKVVWIRDTLPAPHALAHRPAMALVRRES